MPTFVLTLQLSEVLSISDIFLESPRPDLAISSRSPVHSVGYTRDSLFGIPLEHRVQRESASAGLVISHRLSGYTRKIHAPPLARHWSEEIFDCPLVSQIYLAVVSWPISLRNAFI